MGCIPSWVPHPTPDCLQRFFTILLLLGKPSLESPAGIPNPGSSRSERAQSQSPWHACCADRALPGPG